MKNKVVVWGTNDSDEKVLIALELRAADNKVLLYTFPEAIASEEFVNKMMSEWRDNKTVEFPEGHTVLERELGVTESLLPDNLKVERGDVIQRAQTEWHFVVLSSKLHQAYQQELAEFKEKVQALTAYDGKMWDSLKGFWDKVQSQSRERNLFREHANNLRDNINVLFDDLKKMRDQVKSEFLGASQQVYNEFAQKLDDIDARIQAGGSKLNSVFDELKQLQRKYREARLSNEHRNQVWDRLDGAFKAAKERKFGPSANDGTLSERQNKRLEGLAEAIKRMEDSVRRDEDELTFQRKKVDATEGQLEAQIRMAKIKMIEERVNSKREKLAEMVQTRNEVERQVTNIKEKEQRRAEKEVERQKFEAAREAAKSEIAAGIKSKGAAPAPQQEDNLFEAATTVLGDVLLDALDSVKAVAAVVAEKAEEAVQAAVVKADEIVDEFIKEKEEAKEETAVAQTEPEVSTPVAETEVATVTETEPEAAAPVADSSDVAETSTEEPSSEDKPKADEDEKA